MTIQETTSLWRIVTGGPENHLKGINNRKSPPESLLGSAALVNHVIDSTSCNDTEVKDKAETQAIVASTSITPNFSQNKEEEDNLWDDTWVWDIATAEVK
jgi:hypothetical protein